MESAYEGDGKLSRRERERLMRRRAMLNAAKAVFAEKGYANATLDEIAERAEFGKGTLYNYFEEGKEEILFAIFDELYDDLYAIIQDSFGDVAVPDGLSLREAYHRFVVESFEFFMEQEDLFLILVKEAYQLAFSNNANHVDYFHRQQERMVGGLAPALEEAMDSQSVHTLPVRSTAYMMLENLTGLLVHRASLASNAHGASPKEGYADALTSHPEQAADFLTTVFFDGLGVEPSADR